MDKLRAELASISEKRVLDVATRDGAFSKELFLGLKECKQIIALDRSDKKFEEGRKKCAGMPVTFVKGDATEMPFEDNSFDLAAVANSLHHIRDLGKLFSEMKRVVKPGGVIIVSEMYSDSQPSGSLTHWILHDLECIMDTMEGIYHRHTFSRQQIRNLVLGAGLAPDKVIVDKKEGDQVTERLRKRVLAAEETTKKYKEREEYPLLEATCRWMQQEYERNGVDSAEQLILIARNG